jgi:hypothetical protein
MVVLFAFEVWQEVLILDSIVVIWRRMRRMMGALIRLMLTLTLTLSLLLLLLLRPTL